ncbi:MAG: NCS2 family permease, partial [Opitutales bacterium]|nr:NCS2 family permease [Opitutales bacterium]
MNFLDRFFKISERGGSVRTEFFAGLTTFAAMSYILAVNPAILSSAGVDKAGQVYITAFVAGVSTLIMGLFANRPVALAPGMGTNAYLAFFICGALGLRWQEAFALVFYNGLIFFFISLFKIREKIIEAIPHSLQLGLQCGIGAFIVFLGLKNSGIIIDDSATLTAVGDIFSANVLLASAGFVLIAVLAVFRFNFAVMFSILALTAAAFFMHDASGRALAEAPAALVSAPASIPDTVFALDFAYPFRHFWGTLPIILTLLFLDMFDSIGTIVALSRRANFYRNGRIEDVSKILVVDSAATCFGALMGTSTVSC